MLTVIVIVFFISAILMDCLTLLKTMQQKREKAIYYTLMLISFCVLIAYSLNIPVPSPSNGIIKVLDALFHIKK